MDFAALVKLTLIASVILNVFGLGLEAAPQDLTCVLRKPRLLARSLLPINVVMPLLAALIAGVFDLLPPVKIALVALAVSPVPPLLPKRTLRAGGETSYTFGLLVAAGLLAIVFVPAALELIGRAFGVPLTAPVAMILTIVVVTIIAPLGAGALLRHLVPGLAGRLVKPVALGGAVLLLGGTLPVLFKAWPAIVSLVGNGTLAAIAVFILAGLAAGHLFGGPNPEHHSVLAMATAFRHPGVALAIAQANFPEQKLVAAVMLLYLLLGIVLSIPYIVWQRRMAVLQTNSRIVA